MTIPSFKILKSNATQRLAACENAGRVVLVYSGIITILAALVTVIGYVLDLQIAKTGGLSNMGLRSVLSTFQSVIPMVQSMVAMCLEVGYLAAMLRISRRQYTSANTLKLGFDRFWVLLRSLIFRGGIFTMLSFASFWIAIQVYMITPLSKPAMELLSPVVSDPGFTMEALQDEVLTGELMAAMLPMFLIFVVLYAVVSIPVSYSMRMTNYVIIDKPSMGAMMAIRESRNMMRGSRMRLFKLDVSLWWWYLLSAGTAVLAYGDVLLSTAGITLPWSETVSYFLFYALFLAAQFVSCYFLRNRVEVVYAQVYDALKPREKETGVVLGNIFQM